VQLQNNVELWSATANILLMTEQLPSAAVHLLEVLRRVPNGDPRKPHTLYNLGACLAQMNNTKGALMVLSQCLAIAPTHEQATGLMAQVRAVATGAGLVNPGVKK
jgi:Tfp pilus assembly protein PilF